MTPKEKVEELINMFFFNLETSIDLKLIGTRKFHAKQNALKCVDEILKLPMLSGDWQEGISLPLNDRQRPYWQEVKQEIEKL